VQTTAPTANRYKGMVWLDTSFNPAVRRFWSGTAWSTTPQALPFVVQVVPETINGVVVEPGIYGENAFFARLVATRGQIGLLAVDDARMASVSATKITSGSIAVGQHIQSTSYIPGAAGWRINGDGALEVNTGTFRGQLAAAGGTFAGTVNAGGVELGADVGPGTGHFGLSLSPSNFDDIFIRRNDGVRFFRVNGSGSNRITFDSGSGNLDIVTPQFSVVGGNATFSGNVSGGQFNTGGFTGWAWPPSGQTGSHLGPNGLLLGNFNNGRYFQVEANGNLYAPGFSVINGTLAINQANVIGSLQLANNSVTVQSSATGNRTASTNLSIPAGVTARIVVIASWEASSESGNSIPVVNYTLTTNNVTTSSRVVPVSNYVDAGDSGYITYAYPSATLSQLVVVNGPATPTISCTANQSLLASNVVLVAFASWK
jgi:hypothetical protein